MAKQTENFVSVVDFEARNQQLLKVLKQNREALRKNEKAVEKLTVASKRAEKQNKATSRSMQHMASVARSGRYLVGGLIASLGITRLKKAADEWTVLTNRVRLFTRNAREGQLVQEALFRVAQQTRTDLRSTAEVYQRLAQANSELNLKQMEMVGILKTINQALQISGVETVSARAALIQFGQSLAANQLRGQELNSVMEQAPRLAKAIADGLGIPISKMREWAFAGKITSRAIVESLISQADVVDKEFARIHKTIDMGVTVLGNSFTKFVGKINEVVGGSDKLNNALVSISETLDELTEPENMKRVDDVASKWGNAWDDMVIRSKLFAKVVGLSMKLAAESAEAGVHYTIQTMEGLEKSFYPFLAKRILNRNAKLDTALLTEIEKKWKKEGQDVKKVWAEIVEAFQQAEREIAQIGQGFVGPKAPELMDFVMPQGINNYLDEWEKQLDRAGSRLFKSFRREIYSGGLEKDFGKYSTNHPLFGLLNPPEKDVKRAAQASAKSLNRYLDEWEKQLNWEDGALTYELKESLKDLDPELRKLSSSAKMFGNSVADAFGYMAQSLFTAEQSMSQIIKNMLRMIAMAIFEVTVLRRVASAAARLWDSASATTTVAQAAGKANVAAANLQIPDSELASSGPAGKANVGGGQQTVHIGEVALHVNWVGDPRQLTKDHLPSIRKAFEGRLIEDLQRPTAIRLAVKKAAQK